MELRNRLIGKNLVLTAFIICLSFWFLFLSISGTINSGYHFTDDHEIIRFEQSINEVGLIKTIKSTIYNDLKIRFRPVYYLNRLMLTWFFGSNFLVWSIYHAFLAVFTSFFLFLFVYRQGFNFLNALIFPFVTLLGPQAAVWWRLGPSESTGMFLLSISLFLLVTSLKTNSNIQKTFSVFFMIASSLIKESFILFIPAYLCLYVWIGAFQSFSIKNIIKSIKRNFVVLLVIMLVLIVEIYIVLVYVGTNKIGYAGVDGGLSVLEYLQFAIKYFYNSNLIFSIFFGIFILLQSIVNWSFKSFYKENFRPVFLFVFFIIIILIPQLFLYAKSGIDERYLLPANLSLALTTCVLFKLSMESNGINKFTKLFFGLLILCFMFNTLRYNVWQQARIFAIEGRNTKTFVSNIISQTQPSDPLLIIISTNENYEWAGSLRSYLTIKGKMRNVNFLPVQFDTNNIIFNLKQDLILDKAFRKDNELIIDSTTSKYSTLAILPFKGSKKVVSNINKYNEYNTVFFRDFAVLKCRTPKKQEYF